MEKASVTLTIEKEKLEAIAAFLSEENTTVQKKLEESLQRLYEEVVPGDVRKFLEIKMGAKPKRASAPARAKSANKVLDVSADVNPGKENEENGQP